MLTFILAPGYDFRSLGFRVLFCCASYALVLYSTSYTCMQLLYVWSLSLSVNLLSCPFTVEWWDCSLVLRLSL